MEMHSLQQLLNKHKNVSDVTNEGLVALNKLRHEHGCEPLKQNAKLDVACSKHCLYMAAHGMNHNEGFFGHGPGQRISDAGFVWTSYAENIAEKDGGIEDILQLWMSDFGHRRNNLSKHEFAALYSASSEHGKFWCLDLANGE